MADTMNFALSWQATEATRHPFLRLWQQKPITILARWFKRPNQFS